MQGHGGTKHRGAFRGTPGSVCPQPEPNATELPSCAPISARIAQRQGGGGGSVARRARAARAPKPKFCATSCGTSPTTPCAASFTCSPFTCRPLLSLGLPHQQGLRTSKERATMKKPLMKKPWGAWGWGSWKKSAQR